MRIGIGYDTHIFTKNRPLIIGGVHIPHTKGLLGHSDADVLTHTIIDAMFGALALGDIGTHFPDTDPQYKGADSLKLLASCLTLIQKEGYTIGNIDSVLICEEPKMKPHIAAIQTSLATVLGCDKTQVSIKATTNEKMGPTGRGEGIACHAVVLLNKL
jgi:2-C-methyl-D-erythritol 2,4-cyclodiphosphate synthase